MGEYGSYYRNPEYYHIEKSNDCIMIYEEDVRLKESNSYFVTAFRLRDKHIIAQDNSKVKLMQRIAVYLDK